MSTIAEDRIEITKDLRPPSFTLFSDSDTELFKKGEHFRLFDRLGSHIVKMNGTKGVYFAVWAPNAAEVSVIGDFNGWNAGSNRLEMRPDGTGILEGFVPGAGRGAMYKYLVRSRFNGHCAEKRDPFSFYCEVPPARASIVWDISYRWNDAEWMAARAAHNSGNSPISVYEIHFGSWQRQREGNRVLSFEEAAGRLIAYLKETGFTHVEFMPLTAHPLYESWGYQTDGYFAPSARYGSPQGLMALIDKLHQNGIGVFLDWVPSHFPCDRHGLAFFDGTHLYEHADPRKGFHPEWKSSIFNYGRPEVREFLVSSALFWLEKYHADGLRVDGGSSMLYLDYARKHGEWVPNRYGGRENLEAVDFLRKLNETAAEKHPDTQIAVEEATAWPRITGAPEKGGLGFGMKWNMGWMHDTLEYFSKDPSARPYFHNKITFSLSYAFNEKFVLALSHDEVVHGKKSLLSKMPGNDWQRFANLRLMAGYMYAHPGKKLMFMGGELGHWAEWNHHREIDWHLLAHAPHSGARRWICDLNAFYRAEPALYELDFTRDGFEWIDCADSRQSVVSMARKGRDKKDTVLAVFNFSAVTRRCYRIGAPSAGFWEELLNSNAVEYWGQGDGNCGGVRSESVPCHGRKHSVSLTLPALTAMFFKLREEAMPSAAAILEAVAGK